MPLVELSYPAVVVLDVVAWGVVHTATGYVVHRLPREQFDHDTWLTRQRPWERGGAVYRRLGVHRWKDRLPEAGALFAGGTSKRHLADAGLGTDGLRRFAAETRRAELGHWLAAAASPFFALWNPWFAVPLMVAYGIGVNLPFIAIQRYNRGRVSGVLAREARVG